MFAEIIEKSNSLRERLERIDSLYDDLDKKLKELDKSVDKTIADLEKYIKGAEDEEDIIPPITF